MAISKGLEPLIFKKFSAQRQPWWRLEEFGPPNLECVPTPLVSRENTKNLPWKKSSVYRFRTLFKDLPLKYQNVYCLLIFRPPPPIISRPSYMTSDIV
jgi:hypothetical protein